MTDIPINVPREGKKECKGCSKEEYEKNLRGGLCSDCRDRWIKSLKAQAEEEKNDISYWIINVYGLLSTSNQVAMSEVSFEKVKDMIGILVEIERFESGLDKVSKE